MERSPPWPLGSPNRPERRSIMRRCATSTSRLTTGMSRRLKASRRSRGAAPSTPGGRCLHCVFAWYNGSMPGMFKNLIDWTSRFRPQPFDGKHGLLLSASPSMEGATGGSGCCACRSSTSARESTRTCSHSPGAQGARRWPNCRRRATRSVRKESRSVSLARGSRKALPVHQARVGRVPRRPSGSAADRVDPVPT